MNGHDLGIDFSGFNISPHLLSLISPFRILQESRTKEDQEVRHGNQNDDLDNQAGCNEFIEDKYAIKIPKVLYLYRKDKIDVHHILREGKGVSQEKRHIKIGCCCITEYESSDYGKEQAHQIIGVESWSSPSYFKHSSDIKIEEEADEHKKTGGTRQEDKANQSPHLTLKNQVTVKIEQAA